MDEKQSEIEFPFVESQLKNKTHICISTLKEPLVDFTITPIYATLYVEDLVTPLKEGFLGDLIKSHNVANPNKLHYQKDVYCFVIKKGTKKAKVIIKGENGCIIRLQTYPSLQNSELP